MGEWRHSGCRLDDVVTMPVGIVPPMLTAVPGMHAEWEPDADVDTLVRLVRCADELGFDHVTCSEHVAVPTKVAADRGGTYWDPLATLAYLACASTRIRLLTYVLVLGYHHPLALAKRYATLDRLSGGRLTLGVGVGSLEPEFALLGAHYSDRGARADDAIAALRSALGSPRPTHRGRFFAFDDIVVEPTAVQDRVPIWVGGRSERSLRRALQIADGWAPFALGFRTIGEMLSGADVPAGFEVLLGLGSLDPLTAPDLVVEKLARASSVGATRVNASIVSRSPDHYAEQLAALADIAGTSR